MVGHPQQWRLGAGQSLRLAGPQGWRSEEGEEGALALARAYFPEFDTGEAQPQVPLSAEAALRVELAPTEAGGLQLSTRGHSFTVRPVAGGAAPVSRRDASVTFYGPRHFFTALGRQAVEPSGAWLASRVEEYEVLEEGQGSWQARYEVVVPPGVTAVRGAESYLEFLDGGGVPVLRMHYPVARDSAGLSRQGEVRLEGLVASSAALSGGLVRYALAGHTLQVDMALSLEGMQGPVVVDPGWSSTASLAEARSFHSSTLLPGGRVLVAGSATLVGPALASAEVYDPDTGTWSAAAPMLTARSHHTATLLPNGRVLVAGGLDSGTPIASAEVYDPAFGTWSPTGSMATARSSHTATLLNQGRLLVVGGNGSAGALASSEVYDWNTGLWTSTGSLATARASHTATLLPGGRLLVVGGRDTAPLSSAEVYDPVAGSWSAAAALGQGRSNHSATLLFNGRVLVAGGLGASGVVNFAQLYDPATNAWSTTGFLSQARGHHTATLLPSGRVLVAGGRNDTSVLASTEQYDTASGTWSTAGVLATSHASHTATLLPNGKVLLVGGDEVSAPSTRVEAYDPELMRVRALPSMGAARRFAAAVMLPNGKVLVAGGANGSSDISSAELYDPATGTWSPTGSMLIARSGHTATLLPSGKVLVAGGGITYQTDTELYDPATGSWSATGSMSAGRTLGTATLLPSGKVLYAGGFDSAGSSFRSAELYDPSTGTWSSAGLMTVHRAMHSATLLPDGKVLVVGGSYGSAVDAFHSTTTDLYDPVTNSWGSTGSIKTGRRFVSLNLLPNGKVLMAGGIQNTSIYSDAQLYDPATGTWSNTGSMSTNRGAHAAVLLPNGKVLVMGGNSLFSRTDRAELYDPSTGTWSGTVPMLSAREVPVAVRLTDGKVLVAGGSSSSSSSSSLATAMIYEEPRALETWQPTVSTPATLGQGLFTVGGTGFLGLADTGHGNFQSSATNVPLATLLALEGGALRRLPTSSFSNTSMRVTVPSVPEGYYVLSVTTQAISGGRIVYVDRTPPAIPVVTAPSPDATLTTARPTLSGTAEANARVTLYVDGAIVAVVQASASGTWSASLVSALSEGAHVVSVAATDAANNTSPLSAALSFTVDTLLPATPVVTTPANGASLNTSRPVISGTAEADNTVALSIDGIEVGTATASASGAWSYTPTADLAEGVHTLRVTATDTSGNASAPSASISFTVDTVAPAAPAVTVPTSGALLGESRPTFHGTAEAGSTVSVQIDGTPSGVAIANISGAWSFAAPAALVDGVHMVSARASDAAGNSSASSAAISFGVDTVPPPAPVVSTPMEGAILGTSTPVFSGSGEPGSTVSLAMDGTVVGSVTVSAGATWSFTPASAVADGAHTLSARARDAAGNTSPPSATRSFSVDTTPPAIPTVTAPASGAWVATAQPILSGNAEAGSRVSISIDGAPTGTTTASAAGNWSLIAPTALVDGVHSVSATAADTVGNVSASSAPLSFSVDTTPPGAPAVLAPTSGAVLSTPRPTFSGTAEAGSTVTLSIDGTEAGTTRASASGAWSFIPASALAEGTHTVRATATDAAGNTSQGTVSSFGLDLTLPTAPAIAAPVDGATLGSSAPSLTGTAEPGSTITLLLNSTVLGTTIATASGSWSFTPTQQLADGTYALRVTATDGGGNTSTIASISFSVDTTPPVAPALQTPTSGALVNTRTPALAGTAEPRSTVSLSIDGTLAGTTTANAAGAWSIIAPESLADGAHTVSATATDAMGNTSPASSTRTFTVDATPPAAPAVLTPASGASLKGLRPTLSGTAEAGSTVMLSIDGTQAGTVVAGASGDWSFTPTSDLAEGTHTARATATDAAGNTSQTAAVSFTVTAEEPVEPVDPGGCGCASAASAGGGTWGWWSLALLGLWSLRRRSWWLA